MSARPSKFLIAGPILVLVAAATSVAQIDPDRIAGLKARNIGPAGMSGRTAVIEAVPSNPRIVYLGAATGGAWKSMNGGTTWTPLFDDQPVHAIGALAVSPSNPSIVWVGTGEGNTRNSASIGNGVYKSMDGGKTWQHLGLEKTERIYRIALHPADPDTAYVCAPGQEWGENADRGVFRTTDGGKTWQKILYVDEKTGCGDLAMDPSNPRKLFVSMWQFRRWPWFFKSGGPGSGMYTTHDGGTSWRRLQEEDGLPAGELGRAGFAISRSNPEIVYALVEAEKSALLRSDDGGRSWKTVNDSPNVAPRPFYFCDIRVDPAWPNRVYSLDFGVRISEDSGRTFSLLPASRALHGDNHTLWIDPADPNHMYFGDDGGMSESRDRGQTARFVTNLPFAQFYHVAVDGERPYNVYGGLQDNGSWRGPSSIWQRGGIRNTFWQAVGDGDGFDVQPDPKDSTIGYALSQGGAFIRYNTRTGEQRLIRPAPPSPDVRLRFNWNSALAVDPFESGVLYVGSQFVHRSADRGESWTTISPDLTTNDPEKQKQDESGGITPDVTAAENHTSLVAIAPSPVEKGVIWTGSDDGRLHVTRDGGKTWTSSEGALKGVPANTWIPHIEPSPFGGATAFVVLDNHRRADFTPYVFRTDDYGRTWRALATPNVRGYALSIRQDLVKKELLFLGTEFGLYASFDGGARWTHLKKALPTASVMDMVIHPREHDLVMGTHGRAVWVLDDIRPLRALSEQALGEPLKLYEIADAQQYWQKPEDGGFGFGATEFRGENRPYGAILTYSLNAPGLPLQDDEKERERKQAERQKSPAASAAKGEAKKDEKADKTDKTDKTEKPEVQITIEDATGKKVRTFKAPARAGVNRAVWDLTSDPSKQPPRPESASPFEQGEPSGYEVPPGRYTVTMKYAGHEAKQSVNVVADPRSKNTADDWKRRWDALQQGDALSDAVVEAIWRVRGTRDDIAAVEKKIRQAAEQAREKDPKKVDENPLIKEGTKLKESLTALEKKLWHAPEFKGYLPNTDMLNVVNEPGGLMASSWDPPSPNHLDHLKIAEAKWRAFQPEIEKLFGGDVAAYRAKVQEAKIGLLP